MAGVRITLCFILFTCYQLVYAQAIVPKFETLGVNEGLSQSSVYSIYQDKAGFMWFGTGDGLNRYDGSEIKVFKFTDNIKETENSNTVGNLCEDGQGNLWYANQTGIYYYDRISQKIQKARSFKKNEYPSNYFALVTLQNNNLYFENILTGIVAFNIKTKALTRYPYPYPVKSFNWTYHPINYLAIYHDHKIWSHGESLNGLYVFDINTRKFDRLLTNQYNRGIGFGQQHKYLIDHHKILVLDAANRLIDTIPAPVVRKPLQYFSVAEDRYGHLWITTINSGMIMYDLNLKKFYFYKHESSKPNSLPIDMINITFIDANDNLWIGTEGAGVSRLDIKTKKFNQFPLNEGDHPDMTDYFTKCIYETAAGDIYFGTLTSGFCVLNKVTGKLKQYKNVPGDKTSIQSNTVSAIFGDADHNIWVLSTLGVSLFTDGKFSRIDIKGMTYDESFRSPVNTFYQLSNGSIIAAARSGLIYFKKTAGRFEGYYVNKNGYETTGIIESADKQLWIGCPGNGLQRITIDADSITIHEKYFRGINIRSIRRDEINPNTLWISSDKGLIRFYFRSKNFRVYNQLDGMANSFVYGTLEDDAHNIWVSTNSGISYFNRANEVFKNYSVNDGLQSNEFNSGAFFKSASGTLFFGGIKGFNWFNPSRAVTDRSTPLLGITGVTVDDESVLEDTAFITGKKIMLPHNKKSVLIKFAVLDYTLPLANAIEYRLEGLDKEWFKTENKDIRYSNLESGNYTLRVRAVNSSDTRSVETIIKIVVLPPFWKTTSFIVGVFLLMAASIVLITNYISQKKLKKKLAAYERQIEMDMERQRISREMHDDIGAGLTQITLISESLNKSAFKKQREVREIADTSRKLVGAMSEIIWSMNPVSNTLDEFFSYLREDLYKLLEYSGIAHQVDLPEDVKKIILNSAQKRNLLLIVKEIVHNAIKYSKASEIIIKAEFTDTGLKFLISDDGIGFDIAKETHGNGIKNIQKRIADLDGKIVFQSQIGKGTVFTLFILLKSPY